MWPSAVVLSSWLLANPHILYGKQIIELGAGCGLTGLVASGIIAEYEQIRNQQQQQQEQRQSIIGLDEKKETDYSLHCNNKMQSTQKLITLTDFNPKVLTNLDRNIKLNNLSHVATTSQLDFYEQTGSNYEGGWIVNQSSELQVQDCDEMQHPVDLILAADVICKPSDSVAASKTIYDALKPGGEAIIVSANAKHRFGVDIFESECRSIGMEVKAIDIADLCDGKLLPQTEHCDDPCGVRQTSGFVDGMKLTMFQVRKICR